MHSALLTPHIHSGLGSAWDPGLDVRFDGRQTDSFNWDTNPHTPRLYFKSVARVTQDSLPRVAQSDLSPGLDTLDVNPRRTLDVPSTYPRRQARTLDTIFCEDSFERSLVLDI